MDLDLQCCAMLIPYIFKLGLRPEPSGLKKSGVGVFGVDKVGVGVAQIVRGRG